LESFHCVVLNSGVFYSGVTDSTEFAWWSDCIDYCLLWQSPKCPMLLLFIL